MEEKIYSVSEISREIKRVIEQFIPPVWVEGEISNYSASRAGHVYFSLKDDTALINCVIWRSIAGRIPFHLTNGMNVTVRGDVITYAAQSQYQINVKEVRAAGLGSLYLAFEALKNKLSNEGLFAPELKKPIPAYPKRVGVVTSYTGAAIRDILQVSQRRNPAVEMVVFPAQVQGDKAADTIIEGIETFNRLRNVDFIIIGRGGGSIEDLWAFNEEKLVRAIAASDLPVVSAVGHEVDFTLADFVADFRAPTPSAAAEMTIPENTMILNTVSTLVGRIYQQILRFQAQKRQQFEHLQTRINLNNPVELIRQKYQCLDELDNRLIYAVGQQVQREKFRLDTYRGTLKALNPKDVLNRGYAIVYSLPEGGIVQSVEKVDKGHRIEVEVSDGRFDAVVEKK
jgi:exodeoxyribonuclease VII large subunit